MQEMVDIYIINNHIIYDCCIIIVYSLHTYMHGRHFIAVGLDRLLHKDPVQYSFPLQVRGGMCMVHGSSPTHSKALAHSKSVQLLALFLCKWLPIKR